MLLVSEKAKALERKSNVARPLPTPICIAHPYRGGRHLRIPSFTKWSYEKSTTRMALVGRAHREAGWDDVQIDVVPTCWFALT